MELRGRYRKVLLTGAAGRLGRALRPALAARWPLRSADVRALTDPLHGEELRLFDLADRDAVAGAVEGCDAILHFGGIPMEADFEQLLEVNYRGTYHLFDAARQAGVRRVVYASSHHAVGFAPVGEPVLPDAPVRPDSLYGVSKVFGEALGRLYWEKHGIEHVSLRIGIVHSEPFDRRSLGLWLSVPDLCRLAIACLEAAAVGFAIVYGVSANRRGWLVNSGPVAFAPEDDAEAFAERILAAPLPAGGDPRETTLTGGYFTTERAPRWQGPDTGFDPKAWSSQATSGP